MKPALPDICSSGMHSLLRAHRAQDAPLLPWGQRSLTHRALGGVKKGLSVYTEHKASVAAMSGSWRRAGNLNRGLGEAEGGRTRPSGKQSGGCRGPKTLVSKMNEGNSLVVVQWLGFHASTAGGTGSIPGQGTKIPHTACQAQQNK